MRKSCLVVAMLLHLGAVAVSAQDLDPAKYNKLARSSDHDERINAIEMVQDKLNLQSTQMIAAFLMDEHPKVRLRAVKALSKVTQAEAVDFLLKAALKHQHRLIRLGTAEILGNIKDPKTVKPLIETLKDGDPEVRAAAAGALKNIKDVTACDALLDAYRNETIWLPKAFCLEALAALDPAKAADVLRKAVEDRHPAVRMAALEQLVHVQPAFAAQAIPDLLNDTDWHVRVTAAEACEDLKMPELVTPLIDRLAQEKGRVRLDILLALRELTGRDFALDTKTWKAWWDANKDGFKVPEKKSEKKSGKKRKSSEKDIPQAATEFEFFKIPIYSTRIAFVLDLSGSMREEADTKDKKKDDEDMTKLELAKKEIGKTVQAFTPDVFFNVILLGANRDGMYDRPQKVWKSGLAQATPENKSAATTFVNRQLARGWTNIYDALALAMEDPNVDTIFLLSDGGASKGVFVATDEILSELNKINRWRKIMIYAIETKSDEKRRLMKELAELTNGFHVVK